MLIKPFLREPLRHLYKLAHDPEYRRWCWLDARLAFVPRFTLRRARVHGWNLTLPDAASFRSSYQEIFVNRIYQFKWPGGQPRILDLGANIGLSILYFKNLYPQAHITALEADPAIFRHAVHNVHGNGFADVELINKAAWNENTVLRFHSEGGDGGRVAVEVDAQAVEVEALDVRELLEAKRFDFLKIDIEGAEDVVLPAAGPYLSGIKYVFLEYHSRPGEPQRLARLLGLLADHGFRVNIQSLRDAERPFNVPTVRDGFDMQLNIFAWRA
jgi:FkbM family methyltransferase